MRYVVTLFLAVIGIGAPAKGQSIVGKWAVTWDADISIDHDTAYGDKDHTEQVTDLKISVKK